MERTGLLEGHLKRRQNEPKFLLMVHHLLSNKMKTFWIPGSRPVFGLSLSWAGLIRFVDYKLQSTFGSHKKHRRLPI